MLLKIPGNAPKDSEECPRRFRGILIKIPGNIPEDSGECYQRFREMFKKILGNAFNFKLIKAMFHCDLASLYLMKQ